MFYQPPSTAIRALTVLLAMPSDVAISRRLRPSKDRKRRRYNRFSSAPTCSLQGDRHAPESVIGMEWNH